jgi:hypothetical protein
MHTKKRIVSLFAAVLISSSAVFGQEGSSQAFGKGTNVINAGVGLGGYYSYWGNGYAQTPNFVLAYENGTFGNVGPGTISLGGLLSYKGISYNWIGGDGFSYTERWRYWILGFRSAYHLNIAGAPRFDPYGGLMLGYYFLGYTFSTDNPNYRQPGNPGYIYYVASYPDYYALSIFIGARYYLSNSIALWGELGYGYSTLAVGLSFKI